MYSPASRVYLFHLVPVTAGVHWTLELRPKAGHDFGVRLHRPGRPFARPRSTCPTHPPRPLSRIPRRRRGLQALPATSSAGNTRRKAMPTGSAGRAARDEDLARSSALQQTSHEPHSRPLRLARPTLGGHPPSRKALGPRLPHAAVCVSATSDPRHRAPLWRGVRLASEPAEKRRSCDPCRAAPSSSGRPRSSRRRQRGRCSRACRTPSARTFGSRRSSRSSSSESSYPALGAAHDSATRVTRSLLRGRRPQDHGRLAPIP